MVAGRADRPHLRRDGKRRQELLSRRHASAATRDAVCIVHESERNLGLRLQLQLCERPEVLIVMWNGQGSHPRPRTASAQRQEISKESRALPARRWQPEPGSMVRTRGARGWSAARVGMEACGGGVWGVSAEERGGERTSANVRSVCVVMR
jgi:hypothetical protein